MYIVRAKKEKDTHSKQSSGTINESFNWEEETESSESDECV